MGGQEYPGWDPDDIPAWDDFDVAAGPYQDDDDEDAGDDVTAGNLPPTTGTG